MTVFEVLQSRRFIGMVDAYSVYSAGIYGWFFILLPAISAMVPVVGFCDELNKGFCRYMIGRIGIKKYLRRRYAEISCYAACVVLLGLVLYFCLSYIIFPQEVVVPNVGCLGASGSFLEECAMAARDVLMLSVWAIALAGAAFSIALFVSNKYIVVSVPVFFNYVFHDMIWGNMWFASGAVIVISLICIYVAGRRWV